MGAGRDSEQQELQQLLGPEGEEWNATHSDARHLTGRSIGVEFRECAAAGRRLNAKRRKRSLARVFHKHPGFSREARALVPQAVISYIRWGPRWKHVMPCCTSLLSAQRRCSFLGALLPIRPRKEIIDTVTEARAARGAIR